VGVGKTTDINGRDRKRNSIGGANQLVRVKREGRGILHSKTTRGECHINQSIRANKRASFTKRI